MSTIAFLTGIRLFVRTIIETSWRGFAAVLDLVAGVTPMQAAGIFALFVATMMVNAVGMQRHLNKELSSESTIEINPLALEAKYSLLGMLYRVIVGFLNLPFRILSSLLGSNGDDDELEPEPLPSLLVPTLGPSYLWAALITIGVAVTATLVEPLIRWQLDAPAHFPTWQYLLLGHRPELGSYLPLDALPYAGALVIGGFWLMLWWTTARIVRLFHWEYIGRNIISGADDPKILSTWRTYFGVTDLADRDVSYDAWAKWLPLVAIPLLGMAFFSLGGDPYRVGPTTFSIAFVAWISWVTHLRLSGIYRPRDEDSETQRKPEQITAAGWNDVLADLQRLHNVNPPPLMRPARNVEPLAFSDHSLNGSNLISPMLGALLPEPGRLTVMQHGVLATLSRHSFVHLDPPGDSRTLDLGGRQQQEGKLLRHGNQIIIAPEGSGKTTLGILASFNAALLHASSSLIIVRNEDESRRLVEHLRSVVRPSTLRWNLRVRRVGGDLVEDLAAGIIPDVLVCDLQRLVTSLLSDVETYRPFLANLGLIVVDDLETLCGPVEVHAQLAMRRLDLRLRHLRRVEELGEEQAPLFLLLAGDTMDDLPAWARSLCGVDLVPRRFASQWATKRRELARRARDEIDDDDRDSQQAREDETSTTDGRRRIQFIYRLADFKGDEPVTILDLIEACEALAVPWQYRTCGDDRRLLGRDVLPLRNEPRSYVDDPLKAAVLILDGHATAVERELARLGRAGAQFTSKFTPPPEELEPSKESQETEEVDEEEVPVEEIEPIALITVVDADERRLLESTEDEAEMADLVQTLPRPFLRPPSGYLTRRHLTSELIQHWTEVADLLDVFGNDIASLLRDLTTRGALLTDRRTALEPGSNKYEQRVFLRGLESALLGGKNSEDEDQRLLPPPVEDVEVASRRHVAIRERSTLVELVRVDAESARHRFYPGRIFETSRGRHVVVDYARRENSRDDAFEVGDVIAEPFLGSEITSPRRDVRVELVAREDEPLTPEPVYLGHAPIGVGLFPVKCRIRHQATFRLAPDTGEVRQRIYASKEYASKEKNEPEVLQTIALGIYPHIDLESAPEAPGLTVQSARVVAAGLRSVIPLMYRGADAAIGIALHVTGDDSQPELDVTDGFFFYDLHGGANGAARAIERDGVAALLKLTRRLLRRTDDPQRLLALHDEYDGLLDRGERIRALSDALAWLDSRLEHGVENREEIREGIDGEDLS